MATKTEDVKKRPAGINDDFKLVGVDINNVIENNRTVLKTGNRCIEREHLSTELDEGMVIKAYDGGKPQELER